MKNMEKLFIFCKEKFGKNNKKIQTSNRTIYNVEEIESWFQQCSEKLNNRQVSNSVANQNSAQKGKNENLIQNANFSEDFDLSRNDRVRFMLKLIHVYLPEIFPNQAMVDQLVKTIWDYSTKEFAKNNVYDQNHLLFHVNDNEWLRKYITSTIHSVDDKQKIYPDEVDEFMGSQIFKNAHDDFEQRVIKSHIKRHMRQMTTFKEGNFYHKLYNGDFEKYIHNSVIVSSDIIGLNRQAVKRGLEDNAKMWQVKPDLFGKLRLKPNKGDEGNTQN